MNPASTRYELIIYWSKDDDCFVVEVPELPGCMADGRTYAEAAQFPNLAENSHTHRFPNSQQPACRAVHLGRRVTP